MDRKGLIYFIAAVIIFSSMEVASKPLMGVIDPFLLTFYRFVIGFAVLAVFQISTKRISEIKALSKKDLIHLAGLGFLNITFSMTMLQLAIKNTTPATAAVVFSSNPLFVLGFSHILNIEKLSMKKLAGFLVGMTGVVIIALNKGLSLDLGIVYAMLGAVSFALYTVLGKKYSNGISPITVNTVSFASGLIFSLIILLVQGNSLAIPHEIFADKQYLASFLYVGIVVSGISYIVFFNMLKILSASSTSLVFFLKPAVATLFSIMFYGEKISLFFIAGLFVIMIGSKITRSSSKRIVHKI